VLRLARRGASEGLGPLSGILYADAVKVSFIEFLNAVPLGWGFLHGCCRNTVDLFLDVPSQCARRLASGQVDVGLIPVIEYQRIAGLTVLPGIAVAAKRDVRSVLFVAKAPIEEVSRVALDYSSRTSVVLLKILLEKFYARTGVTFESVAVHPEILEGEFDAALVIGNPALLVNTANLHVYDLAAEWNRFTGLPFVFAFWAIRSGFQLHDQARLFYQSREEGLANIQNICAAYSAKLGIPGETIRSYLRNNLDYSLDEPNLRGLDLFYAYSAELGLIPAARPLAFHPAPV
jgi:chorismate dehydratase